MLKTKNQLLFALFAFALYVGTVAVNVTPQKVETFQEISQVLGVGSGKLYYVDFNAGLDTNNGTSEATPWKTLSKVSSTVLKPGDVVHLKRGSSWNGNLELSNNEDGTATDPIVIRAYGTGNKPVISNTTAPDSGGRYRAISILGDYYIIEDIRITDAQYSAVEVFETAKYNTIQNTEIDNSGVAVRVKGSSTTIRGNNIHDLKMVKNDPAPETDYGALGVSIEGNNNNIDSTLIEGNTFKNCIAESMDYGFDGGAVEIFGDLTNTTIRYNYTQDNKGFTEVGGPTDGANRTVKDTFIHNNVMKDNAGILVLFNGGSNQYKANVQNFRVENNTVYESKKALSPIYFQGDTEIASQFFFINNFVYLGTGVADTNFGDKFTHQYNIYKRWGGTQLGITLSTGETQLTGEPLFVDATNGNFKLQASSPLIDKGTTLSNITRDFDGTTFPQGTARDVGAFEFKTETTTVVTCTNFTYSDWGTCTNGSKQRTVASSTPANCTGGTPVLTEACSTNTGNITCGPVDVNSDHLINILDFAAFAKSYGKTCQ